MQPDTPGYARLRDTARGSPCGRSSHSRGPGRSVQAGAFQASQASSILAARSTFLHTSSSIGRAPDSKSDGSRFDSVEVCHPLFGAIAKRSKAPVCKSGVLCTSPVRIWVASPYSPSPNQHRSTTMATHQLTRRAPRPRNPVVRAIIQRINTLGAGRHRTSRKRARQHDENDLAQRVRESGEW